VIGIQAGNGECKQGEQKSGHCGTHTHTFQSFLLLTVIPDHTLYSSHTVWQSKRAFEAWTKSEEFRASHARAGNETTGPLYLEHPKFEGFEVRQTIARKATAA
jgi:heme-degrading monooxygenase HmoA